jgi:hypothetical protein
MNFISRVTFSISTAYRVAYDVVRSVWGMKLQDDDKLSIKIEFEVKK